MENIDSQVYVKQAICQYLNSNSQGDFPEIQVENVIALRVTNNGAIVTLIDCGIKGTPKFTIPSDKLEFNLKPNIVSKEEVLEIFEEIEAKELEPKPKKQTTNGRRKRGKK